VWPFKNRSRPRCGICGRRLTLPKSGVLGERTVQPYHPYRCAACGRVFHFSCLDKRKGAVIGPKSYVLELVCPRCGTPEVERASVKPIPETPERLVSRRAKELQAKHGGLVEVRCRANDDIELVYADGTSVDGCLDGRTQLLTCGYAGQGPRQLHAFLRASEFHISLEAVYETCAPYTLRPGDKSITK
jgi:rubredoxin